MSNKKLGGIFLVISVLIILGFGAYLLSSDKESKQINSSSSDIATSNNGSNGSENTSEKAPLTAEEVQKHSTKSDCWTIINGKVYDVTGYVNRHPGGNEILLACGKDGTSLFVERKTSSGNTVGSGTPHDTNAANELAKLMIGTLQ